jgi:hypothetical protein
MFLQEQMFSDAMLNIKHYLIKKKLCPETQLFLIL